MATEIKHQSWQGPLPSPQTMEEFRDLVPDLPERIVAQWEKETEHRQTYEMKALDASIGTDRRGQWIAATFAFSSLILSGIALYLHEPWVAGIVGGGTIGTVVTAFLYKSTKKHD